MGNKINYHHSDGLVEITVKDRFGRKIDRWMFNLNDKKMASIALRNLKEKYGFTPEIHPKDSVTTKNQDWWDIEVP